jgi:hypothetical protein
VRRLEVPAGGPADRIARMAARGELRQGPRVAGARGVARSGTARRSRSRARTCCGLRARHVRRGASGCARCAARVTAALRDLNPARPGARGVCRAARGRRPSSRCHDRPIPARPAATTSRSG